MLLSGKSENSHSQN